MYIVNIMMYALAFFD